VIEHPDDEDAQLVVWRPQGAIVMLNKFPYNPGHAMVAPIAHKASLEDLDDAETADLMRAMRRTITVLRQVMNPDGLNAGVNIGRAAGAGIPEHVHFHIVPRWNGDTNFMAVIDDVKIVNEALSQTAEKLKQAFAAT
jgi:ATP adenylyltransferase